VREGRVVFIDSAVDTASGTIRIKAEFTNADGKFWPGMFANVTLVSSTLSDVLTVPTQALQTGPHGQFVFVVGKDHKTHPQPVTVRLIQDGIAVVEGLTQGECVVIEGMQNLRPGSTVRESSSNDKSAQSACGRQFLSDQAQWIPDSGAGMFSSLNAISAPK
jgi:membrane fusion protein, multidrug efflux system